MNEWLTAEEIAAATGRPVGTVYRWAHENGWRRTKTKPRGYRTEDVFATLDRSLTTDTH